MSLNQTPRGNRLHIAIFGRRNAGKSALINALLGQEIAITSDVPGTTADPVYKAAELHPIGPCVIIDTCLLYTSVFTAEHLSWLMHRMKFPMVLTSSV